LHLCYKISNRDVVLKTKKKNKKKIQGFSASFVFLFVVLSFTPRNLFAQYGSSTYGTCYYGINNCKITPSGGGGGGGGTSSGGSTSSHNVIQSVTSPAPSPNTSVNSNTSNNNSTNLPTIKYTMPTSADTISLGSRLFISLSTASLITGIAWLLYLIYHHHKNQQHHHKLRHA